MSVYFIVAAGDPRGNVKIGTCKDVETRMHALAGDVPSGVLLLAELPNAGPDMEKSLHDLFDADRGDGEWFTRSAALDEIIRRNSVAAPRLFSNRTPKAAKRDSGASEYDVDAAIAHDLLDVIFRTYPKAQSVKSLVGEVAEALRQENSMWTPRRVRALWNCEARRVDHWEIRRLQEFAERRKTNAAA